MSATSTAAIEIRFLSSGAGTVQKDIAALTTATRNLSRESVGSFRREQRIEQSLVGLTGLTGGPVDAALNKFQYLQFVAGNMNMTIGSMLAKFGPMAGAIALTTLAWERAKTEVSEINSKLSEMGMKQIGFVDFLKLGVLGDTSVVKLDPKAMYARTQREVNGGLSEQVMFEKEIAKTTDLTLVNRRLILREVEGAVKQARELKSLEQQLADLRTQSPAAEIKDLAALEKRMKELPGLISGAQATTEAGQVPQSWRDDAAKRVLEMQIELEKLRLRRPDLARDAAEKTAKDAKDAAEKSAKLEDDLRGARGRLRDRQMGDVERGAAPWRDLSSLNWFANSDAAGSQADRLNQFRAGNQIALPESVDAQLKELRQREVEELGALTAAIQSLEARIRTAGGDPNTIGEWSTTGAF
jgi:hypothetical protein